MKSFDTKAFETFTAPQMAVSWKSSRTLLVTKVVASGETKAGGLALRHSQADVSVRNALLRWRWSSLRPRENLMIPHAGLGSMYCVLGSMID